ncbi:MAG: hypothetical protein ACXACY_26730 [Candidatus Hodarchaeales archaeon]|jgi:DNA-binding Lrp family transcriptional regulator
MKRVKMSKQQLLAAELYAYSYDNYADHIEVGNIRFTKLMPTDIRILEKAERESWPNKKIAKALEIEESNVEQILEKYEVAKSIINAENASESFRRAVKESIKSALDNDGLKSESEIDNLVIQICYRAADLGYLLELDGKKLSDYSDWLRRDKDVDYTGVNLPNLE